MSENTLQTMGLRALVVDDSTTIRRLMDLTLRPLGMDLEFADNGEDAVHLAKTRPYDIIFLDIMLPVIDGYRVCKMIKSDKASRNVAIVMLTSKDSTFDRVKGIMAGTDVYLTKPLARTELLKAIARCIPEVKFVVNIATT